MAEMNAASHSEELDDSGWALLGAISTGATATDPVVF